ncbi:ATPase [Priestia megaterium]|nr:ATPase [Priestia megaterium]
MNGLSIFTFDEIAKMTSKNSVDLKRVGFGKTIKGTAAPLTRLEMTFPDGQTETIKTDAKGLFEVNFTSEVKQNDEIILAEKLSDKIVTSSRLETMITINKITRETGATKFTVEKQHPTIHVKEVTYFTKPIAIFMVTPDYDSSNHVIASIFVRQLYYILAKNASLARGNKCHREVVFLLDEYGNMPAIQDMANIITVCLGRNIRFNLIIQAYAQLKNKYGDDAETIEGNCGNTIYILSNNYETAKTISQKLGDGTINSTSRSGKGLSTDKSKTEGVDGKPLLTPNELMELKEGESVVVRVVKRQDKARQRIKAHPIYNTGKTALKYRWEYLGEDFDTDRSILDIDISSLHEQVNPQSLVIHNFFPFQSQAPSVEKEEELDDDPFTPLTYENYKTKTVKKFFDGDKNVSIALKEHLPQAMNKTVEEIEQQSMSEFEEELKMLGVSDQLNKNVHQLLEVKINTIIKKLQHEMEEQEAYYQKGEKE